jgi:hypothetical protein
MHYIDPIKYSKQLKKFSNLNENREVSEMSIPPDGHKKMTLSEKVKSLSPEKREELNQYVETIKEIKKKINEMLEETPKKVDETGGNMSSGLYLSTEE